MEPSGEDTPTIQPLFYLQQSRLDLTGGVRTPTSAVDPFQTSGLPQSGRSNRAKRTIAFSKGEFAQSTLSYLSSPRETDLRPLGGREVLRVATAPLVQIRDVAKDCVSFSTSWTKIQLLANRKVFRMSC